MTLPHLALALIANLAWGGNFIAGKIGTEHFQPLFFTGLRFLFLLILLFPWLRPAEGKMRPLLQVAVLLGVVHFAMIFVGLSVCANIASIAVVAQLYVPFSAIFAAIHLGERLKLPQINAILTAFGGVLLIGFDPADFQQIQALFWTIGGALCMAIATILMRQCPDIGVLKLQAWIAAVATPSHFLLSFLFESGQLELLRNTDILDFWSPLYSAIGASIIGHGFVYYLLGRYPVATVTPLLLLSPVLASVFGVLFFGDILSWKLVVGGCLTLVSILFILIAPKTKSKDAI
ncbi:MAG: EamA family transporter [Deltaproteobacteria bacterium]|nr:MAG: EamA family transporter [Deltaproteobacteria bacterium]